MARPGVSHPRPGPVVNSDGVVLRFAHFHLDSSRRRRTEDGALIVPGRLSRTGIQVYDQGNGEKTREYRPPEEVFSDEAVASFNGVILTDLHPPEGLVTPSTFRKHARGHIQNPRRDGDHLLADFYIHDGDLIASVERNDRVELSAGYYARLDYHKGTTPEGEKYDAIQRDIRGNHVALLPEGMARAGRSARLLDSNGNELPQRDEQPPDRAKETRRMDEFTIMIGGVPYVLKGDATARQALEKYMKDSSGLAKERDEAQARADAAEERAEGLDAELKDARDPARIDEAAKVRADLIARAKRLGGADLDTTGNDREVMARALAVKGVDVEGRSDDYVAARFDAAVEALPAGAGSTVNDVVTSIEGNPKRYARKDTDRKGHKFSTLRKSRRAYLDRQEGGSR